MRLVQHLPVGSYTILHGGRARSTWLVLGPLTDEHGIRPTVAHGSFAGMYVQIKQGVVGPDVLRELMFLALDSAQP